MTTYFNKLGIHIVYTTKANDVWCYHQLRYEIKKVYFDNLLYVVKLQSKTLNLGCKTLKYLLTYLSVSKRSSLCCFKNLSLCLLHTEVPCLLQCDKKGHASKKRLGHKFGRLGY